MMAEPREAVSTPRRSWAPWNGIGKGQRADEQAHGEADTAEHANPEERLPSGACGHRCHAARHGKLTGGETSKRLADHKPGDERTIVPRPCCRHDGGVRKAASCNVGRCSLSSSTASRAARLAAKASSAALPATRWPTSSPANR